MDVTLGLIIMAELALTLFIIWGFAHEDVFIVFENSVLGKLAVRKARRRLRLIIAGNQKSGEDAA